MVCLRLQDHISSQGVTMRKQNAFIAQCAETAALVTPPPLLPTPSPNEHDLKPVVQHFGQRACLHRDFATAIMFVGSL